MKMRGGKHGCCEHWNCKNSCSMKGSTHACVLPDDNNLICWEYNPHGQVGRGDTQYHGNGVNEMGDYHQPVDLEFTMTETCPDVPTFLLNCWFIYVLSLHFHMHPTVYQAPNYKLRQKKSTELSFDDSWIGGETESSLFSSNQEDEAGFIAKIKSEGSLLFGRQSEFPSPSTNSIISISMNS